MDKFEKIISAMDDELIKMRATQRAATEILIEHIADEMGITDSSLMEKLSAKWARNYDEIKTQRVLSEIWRAIEGTKDHPLT